MARQIDNNAIEVGFHFLEQGGDGAAIGLHIFIDGFFRASPKP